MTEDINYDRIESSIIGTLVMYKDLYFSVNFDADIFVKRRKIAESIKQSFDDAVEFDFRTLSAEFGVDFVDECISNADYDHFNMYYQRLKDRHTTNQVCMLLLAKLNGIKNGEEDVYDAMERVVGGIDEIRQGEDSKGWDIKDFALRMIEEIDEYAESGKKKGILTGFGLIDTKIGGLHKTDQMVIAARPSVGKTSLMVQVMRLLAERGVPIGLFSIEMPATQIIEVMVSQMTGISRNKIRSMNLNEEERKTVKEAIEYISSLPIYIEDSTSDIQQIKHIARVWHQKHNVEVFFYDYIQLITDKRYKTRYDIVTSVSGELKRMIKRKGLNAVNVVLSQLSRGDGEPTLQRLKESGSLEQDANSVVFLHEVVDFDGEVDLEDKSDTTEVDIIIAKNRAGERYVRQRYDRIKNLFQESSAMGFNQERISSYLERLTNA